MNRLLILDAGHAEKVAGKRSPDGKLLEWEFNNDMQYRIKKRAEELGIPTYLTNPSPKGINEMGLSNRCQKANAYWSSKGKPKAMFISLHANAFSNSWSTASGTETFVAKNASSASRNFAKDLNDQIVKDMGTKNRGVKTENFAVIKGTNCPCVLVEYGFYSNKTEVLMLINKRDMLVEATIKAICRYFNIAYKAPNTNNTQKPVITVGKSIKIGQYDANVKVTATKLNVRSKRGSQQGSVVVGSFAKGHIVNVWTIDKAPDGSLWGSCRVNSSTTGFIHMGYVEPV